MRGRGTRARWAALLALPAIALIPGAAGAERKPGYLTVSEPTRSSGGQYAVRARLKRRAHFFSAKLNGEPIRDDFIYRGRRVRRALLDADHGLRPGRNRLVIRASREDGPRDREVERFKVPRGRPLAGAGRAEQIDVTERIRLDGRNSRATDAGRRLRYRWEITRAPKGSEATLKGAATARPKLRPDAHGRYKLELTVRGPRGGRAASAGLDQVVVPVTPFTPPVGLPIDTMPAPGQISINGRTQKLTGDWIQLVAFDRQTLEIKRTQSFSVSQSASTLTSAIAKDPSTAYVLTGGGRAVSLDDAHVEALRAVIKQLGGTERTLPNAQYSDDLGLAGGNWSILGYPGAPGGSAHQRWGGNQNPFLPKVELGGPLRGYLQLDSGGNYAFASPNYLPFDTETAIAGGQANRITIGDTHYDSATLPPGQPGVQILQLDQNTLRQVDNYTYRLNISPTEPDDGSVNQIASELNALEEGFGTDYGTPMLIIVQTIGDPVPLNDNWTREGGLIDGLASIGATPDVVAMLDGSGGYSLVGGTRLPGRFGSENSEAITKSSGLTGVLSQNRQGQFTASDSAPGDVFDPTIYTLAYQAPTPWPASGTPGLAAANSYFARELGLENTRDVRINYWAHPVSWTSDQYLGRIADPDDIQYIPCPADAPGFTVDDCTQVREALVTEFGYLANVELMLDGLQALVGSKETSALVDAKVIAGHVSDAVKPPPKANASINPIAVLVGVSKIVSALSPPPASNAAGAVSGALSIATAVESGSATGPNAGEPLSAVIIDDVADIDQRLDTTFQAYGDSAYHVRDLLVSDFAKLRTASEHVADGTFPDNQATPTRDELARGLTISAEQVFYPAFLRIAYRVYALGTAADGSTTESADKFRCIFNITDPNELKSNFVSFKAAAPNTQFSAIAGLSAPGKPYEKITRPRAMAVIDPDSVDDDASRESPPDSLLAPLFASPEGGGLGLDKVTFFGREFEFVQLSGCGPAP